MHISQVVQRLCVVRIEFEGSPIGRLRCAKTSQRLEHDAQIRDEGRLGRLLSNRLTDESMGFVQIGPLLKAAAIPERCRASGCRGSTVSTRR